jgi:CheY-like chemotaxis protein
MIPQLEYPSILQQLGSENKNTLHEVLVWLQLLTDDPLSPAQYEHIDQCRKSLQRVIRVNEDALMLSSLASHPSDLVAFSPAECVRSICQVLEPLAAQRNLTIEVEAPSSISVLEADRSGFEQVVSRTVGFAIRSLENAGLTLSVRSSLPGPNGMVTVEVAFRFDELPLETGDIGLHVAAQIALRMGGALKFVTAGDGPHIHFSFEARPAGESSFRGDAESHLRILVAEDSDESFLLFSMMLQDEPFSIQRAVDGEEAVALAASGRYDIAFMDVTMPRLNGYAATLRIREWETKHCRKRMPIVVLSADPLESQMREGATVGCSGYLEKPVPRNVLLDTLSRYGTDIQRDRVPHSSGQLSSRPRAEVKSLLRPIVPQFLATQQKYAAALEEALNRRDFERIRIIGHNMKGTGKGYGFEPITEIGKALESAGQSEDTGAIRSELKSLSKYLSEVDVIYT